MIQGYLDETNEEGLMILCDVEKAFDSCSWDYLLESTKSLGFGRYMRDWFGLLYNHDAPPTRQLKINGQKGPRFSLNSGVPQGDPLSPLAFLFITEAFTRLIIQNEQLQGIKVGNTRHKISQFADDTILYLRGFSRLPIMWKLISILGTGNRHAP